MKVIVARMTGEGEQWNIEVEVPNKVFLEQKNHSNKVLAVRQYLEPVVAILDDRMVTLNNRIMDAMGFAKSLSPEQNFAIRQVFDIMGGRAPQMKPESQQPVPQEVVAADQAAVDQAVAELKASGEAIEGGKLIKLTDHKPKGQDLQGV